MISGTLNISTTEISGTISADNQTVSGEVSLNQIQVVGTVGTAIYAILNPAIDQRITDLELGVGNTDYNFEQEINTFISF